MESPWVTRNRQWPVLSHVPGQLCATAQAGGCHRPHGTIKLFAGLVRIPDVAFASWDRFPDRKRPKTPIPHLATDLVVEVLSKSKNTSLK